MSGINRVILVGHLGKDPIFRHLTNGDAVVSFPLATSENIIKAGQLVEHTEWHNIIMWKDLAETAVKLLKKNSLIYIDGKLTTRSFIDSAGIKKYSTEVIVSFFRLLSTTQVT